MGSPAGVAPNRIVARTAGRKRRTRRPVVGVPRNTNPRVGGPPARSASRRFPTLLVGGRERWHAAAGHRHLGLQDEPSHVASCNAAASRSLRVRSRAVCPAFVASLKISVRRISKRSRASSSATASTVAAKATRVARRRDSEKWWSVAAFAVMASRANVWRRLGGTRCETFCGKPKVRISPTRRSARTSSGALRRNGPWRRRSKRERCPPAGTVSKVSNWVLQP